VSLKEWDEKEMVNVDAVAKLASRFKLTGKTLEESLTLSNPDSTQPAPWTKGLAMVLKEAVCQISILTNPTALFPWVFIPDGQVFHFFIEYTFTSSSNSSPYSICVKYAVGVNYYPIARKALEKLAPRAILEEIVKKGSLYRNRDENKISGDINMAAIYLYHHRNETPREKSQVKSLNIYGDSSDAIKSHIWPIWWTYPWLRKYVHFGREAVNEMLEVFNNEMQPNLPFHTEEARAAMLKLKSGLDE